MAVAQVPFHDQPFEPHSELTQAHRMTAKLCGLLRQYLSEPTGYDNVEVDKQAIHLGAALLRVAWAERECGSCLGQNHFFTASYSTMLEEHRLAFMAFEQLSGKLESATAPPAAELAGLVGAIGRHLELAEQAHQSSITAPAAAYKSA